MEELIVAVEDVKPQGEHDLSFLDSKFPLFGFMRDSKKQPKMYLWQGIADAIAYSRKLKKYVVMDLKVVNNLSDYWQSKTDLCGKHLHQCLVYAKLLQLHMKLDYLPPSLIVVVHRATGKEGYFLLFKDYPDECKERLNDYEWFKTPKVKRRPLKIEPNAHLETNNLFRQHIKGLRAASLKPEIPLRKIFKETATVEDLLKALGYDSLQLV